MGRVGSTHPMSGYTIEQGISEATGALGGLLGWSFNTLCSAVIGFLVGSVVVGVLHLMPIKKAHAE